MARSELCYEIYKIDGISDDLAKTTEFTKLMIFYDGLVKTAKFTKLTIFSA